MKLHLFRSFWFRYAAASAGLCVLPAGALYFSLKTENSEEELERVLTTRYAKEVRSAKEKNAKIRELWAAQQRGDPEVLAKYEQVLKGGKRAGSFYQADKTNRKEVESGKWEPRKD